MHFARSALEQPSSSNNAPFPLPALLGKTARHVHLYALRYDAREFVLSDFKDAGLACPPQIERATRKRQARYFHGRVCARRALIAANAPILDVRVGLRREPVWPPGFIGSISHSSSFAAVVVAAHPHAAGLGIDLGIVVPSAPAIRLMEAALSSDELDYLRSLAMPGHALLLTLAFCAKEAFLKAAFSELGRIFSLDAVRIVQIDVSRQRVRVELRMTLSALLQRGSRHEVRFAMLDAVTLCTVCVRRHGALAMA